MPQLQFAHCTILFALMYFAHIHLQIHSAGSVSASFTCSLLLHLKVVGAGLSGCPPFLRHISYSVQFLWREVVWGKQSRMRGCEETNRSYFLQTLNLPSGSKLKPRAAMAKKCKLYDNVARMRGDRNALITLTPAVHGPDSHCNFYLCIRHFRALFSPTLSMLRAISV